MTGNLFWNLLVASPYDFKILIFKKILELIIFELDLKFLLRGILNIMLKKFGMKLISLKQKG